MIPGQGATERAPAAPQLYGKEIVAARRQSRPGETQDRAARLQKGVEFLPQLRRRDIGVGKDQHIHAVIEQTADRVGVAGLGFAQVGERHERVTQIMHGRKKGLLRAAAGDEADAPPSRGGIEQENPPGGIFAENLKPRNFIAQLDRQVDVRRRAQAVEIEIGLAERGPLGVIGADFAFGLADGG